ncbi:DNA polymerase III subunit gamma/tau [Desulfovibrio sp. SGI.169]|uniref:DNA polymerase III subunit gamma/tau n=1 Tax=Desulfovibrio sp. SGI.169 TaxID=3420561 RepID=UPI003D085B18
MKHLSLAARYRPQTFAQVAGQDMVKAVLSRAAAEDRPAAAYLLSGTRGVGKTTIARIFAKALNCERAPAPEPCNQCAQCRKITQGVHVDVTEIDGASNNSVEDARSLRETVGYAPMEGRYKIFIIDEAHMLTRNAFNALLKTLEEPPERVVFIFATTEAHKFPVTIVSRCQHFVFRHLGEDALTEHLSGVLRKEKIAFEEGAARLLARRAAGSVRDGMSLLDQALALGGASLTTAMTRDVLGLAGQELFGRLFEALHGRDCAAVAELSRQILQQGVDIGFFVRELAGNLRNLFLLRQGGAAMLPSLRLPADEAAFQQALAPRFSAGHLHAAWQMTLDAQRGIVQSPEPAAALELLLLNLALLPQLLPLERLPQQEAAHDAPTPPPTVPPDAQAASVAPRSDTPPTQAAPQQPAQRPAAGSRAPEKAAAPETEAEQEPDPAPADPEPVNAPATPAATGPNPTPGAKAEAGQAARPGFQRDWQAFCEFCAAEQSAGRPAPQPHLLRGLGVDWQERRLRLTPKAQTLLHQMEKQRGALEAALAAFGAGAPRLEFIAPRPPRGEAELIEEFSRKPELQPCLEVLQASIVHCTEIK